VIAGLVLAAGLSRRMGQPKLLLPLGGRPVIRWSVERVLEAGVGPVIVVAGHERAAIEAVLSGLPVRVVANPEPEAGQGRSIAVGVAALPADSEAVLVALGDQPDVPREVVAALVAALRRGGAMVAAPVYREGQGTPVLFARRVFPELLALSGDRGARAVVERDPGRVALVALDLPMPPDVDTREQYDALARDERRETARPRSGAGPATDAGGVH
jgi:molybdenum cofactor cytidylyltransferase